jgi:glycylpeptide N-tetradecanoyltransferase
MFIDISARCPWACVFVFRSFARASVGMAAEEEVKIVEEEEGENPDTPQDQVSKKKKKKKSKKQQEEEARSLFKAPIDPNEAMKQIQSSLGEHYDSKVGMKHTFWDKQPVLKLEDQVGADENGPIEPNKPIDQIKQEPYSLGDNFVWEDIDVDSEEKIMEVYNLLKENYVEDDDNMFRFDYSVPFLLWALKPPGYRKDWHLGIRRVRDQQLVGFITAIPATVRIYEKKMRIVEINFLCVHKKLRHHQMAPHLIREITRRVNMTGIFQAVYTAGIVLPKPVASCQYYHRSLDPIKLMAIRFSPPPKVKMSNAMIQKLYRLPSQDPMIPNIRPLTQKDVGKACVLLAEYLKKFHISASFDEHEFAHWFIPRDGFLSFPFLFFYATYLFLF